MMGLWFDEIGIGSVYDLGAYDFTRENVLAFARKFDPQAFHLDDDAAGRSHFGRLSASGWHTAAGWMKCYVAANTRERERLAAEGKVLPEGGPSPGCTALKWLRPVYPGDTISYRAVLTGKRVLASRPEWGIVESRNEGMNQAGEKVFAFEGKVLVARRNS
jgi:acyl dehydratase